MKTTWLRALLFFFAFGVQVLAACSGRVASSPSAPPPRLASLTVSNATLSPPFSPGTTSYTLTIPPTPVWDSALVSVSATAAEAASSVTVDGRAAPEGAPVDVRLLPGASALAVTVIAVSGLKTTYTLSASLGPTGEEKLEGATIALSADGTTLATMTMETWPNLASIKVYTRGPTGWVAEASFPTPNPTEFMGAVALSADGNTLLVGLPLVGVPVLNGAAAVYVRSSGSWSQQAVLKDGTQTAVGSSVALSADGNTAAVGAALDSTAGDKTGAAYIFSRTGSSWTKTAKLYPTNAATGGHGSTFGQSVALSGDGTRLAVGAQRESSIATGVNPTSPGPDDTSAPQAGAVYVFTLGGGTWSPAAYLKASNTPTGETAPTVDGTGWPGGIFGYSVAFSGDGHTLAVGASLENSIATGVNATSPGQDNRDSPRAGAVYVFTESGGTWSQSAYVKASNTPTAANGGSFGFSVALSADGTTLAAGATQEASAAIGVNPPRPAQDDLTLEGAGAVYLFRLSNGTWTQRAYVKASSKVHNQFFGFTVALSADGATLAASSYASASFLFH